MPRTARIVIPDIPHHVTHRGNRAEQVFFDEGDYRYYLGLLRRYAGEHGLAIQAYCLMPNHLHLVSVPFAKTSLASVLKRVHIKYTQRMNRINNLTGNLWENRPWSCPMDSQHCWAAVRYVERNPVRARIVSTAENYP